MTIFSFRRKIYVTPKNNNEIWNSFPMQTFMLAVEKVNSTVKQQKKINFRNNLLIKSSRKINSREI